MITYDPATAARLIAEARQDDSRPDRPPTDLAWLATHTDLLVQNQGDRIKLHAIHDELFALRARSRTLRAMADQLETAVAEVKQLYTLAIEQGERAVLAEWEIDRMLDGRVEVELHVGQDPDDCDPPPAKIDHDVEAWRQDDPDIRDEDR